MALLLSDHPAVTARLHTYLPASLICVTIPQDLFIWPDHALGVDVDGAFEAELNINPVHLDWLTHLQKALAKTDRLLIATAPSLAGEWLAWQILNTLRMPDKVKIERLWLTGLDTPALDKALAEPRHLRPELVSAHLTRHTLERLVAYTLWPLLSRRLERALTISLAELMALDCLAQRAAALAASTPTWQMATEWVTLDGQRVYRGRVVAIDDQACETLSNREDLADGLARLEPASVAQVTQVDETVTHRFPDPPLTTARLLAQMSRVPTQSILKTLFQGYVRGQITYPLTASRAVPPALWQAQRSLLDDHASDLPLVYDLPGETLPDQVALLPTQAVDDPQSLAATAGLSGQIIRAFLASFTPPSRYLDQTVQLTRTDGQTVEVHMRLDEAMEPLHMGDTLRLRDVALDTVIPPQPHTASSLLMALERLVEPIDLVTLIADLEHKGLVVQTEDSLHLTATGQQIAGMLSKYWGDLLSRPGARFQYQQQLAIVHSRTDRLTVLRHFWADYLPGLKALTEDTLNVDPPTGELVSHAPLLWQLTGR